MTGEDEVPGRAAEEQADRTDDAIDAASRDVGADAERAARQSGYADGAASDETDDT
jgi:hypothetical protein